MSSRQLWAIALLLIPLMASANPGKNSRVITTAVVEEHPINNQIGTVGTLQARQAIEIRPQVQGRITALPLTDGAEVEAGQILIQLDDREQKAKVTEAQVALDDAKRQLRYFEKLMKTNAIARDQLEAQQAQVEKARASLAAAAAQLDHYQLKAPFSGVLGQHDAALGQLLDAGAVVTSLDDISVLKLDFSLPESALSQLTPSQSIHAYNPAWPDETFIATVTSINPRVDHDTRSLQVRAKLANPEHKLRPGMLMTLQVPVEARTAMTIPARSVLFDGNRRYAYVVDGQSIAHTRTIQTGSNLGDFIEVKDGLEPGEIIVDQGVVKVRDGIQVQEAIAGNQPANASSQS